MNTPPKPKCQSCGQEYEPGLGGPVAFICKNPDCPSFDQLGYAEWASVDTHGSWQGLTREPKK